MPTGKSVIRKPKSEESAWGGFTFTLASIADDMIQYGSDVKGRDVRLRAFWPSESVLASALYAVATRNAAFQWTLDGPPRTVNIVQDMLLNANDGAGWIDFIYRWTMDYLTQDNGCHVELVRLTDAADSPVVGVNNLDARECRRTGVPEYPIIYTDRLSYEHKLAPHHVYSVADMPSPVEKMNGVGFCTVSRILRMAQYIRDLVIHDREKISGADPKRLYIVGNVSKKELENAMQGHKQQMLEQGYVRYIKPVILPILDPSTPPAVATLDLATLPEGFNKDTELKWYVTFVALALGVDYQDLAPLSSGTLGTASQSQVLHLKSKGKGAAMFQKRMAHMMNFSGILPRNVTFRWDEQDIDDEIQMANLRTAKANTFAVYLNTQVYTVEAVRQMLLDEGEISEEIFDMLGSAPDVTQQITVEDIEAAMDQQRGTETVEEDQKGGPGSGHFDHEGRPGEVGGSAPSGEMTRVERARATYVPVTDVKRAAARAKEKRLADALKGTLTPDGTEFDVIKGGHAIEVKNIQEGAKNDKVTVHPQCRRDKEAFARLNKLKSHMVVFDDRTNKVYYRAGVGAYRLSHMEEVTLDDLVRRLA